MIEYTYQSPKTGAVSTWVGEHETARRRILEQAGWTITATRGEPQAGEVQPDAPAGGEQRRRRRR